MKILLKIRSIYVIFMTLFLLFFTISALHFTRNPQKIKKIRQFFSKIILKIVNPNLEIIGHESLEAKLFLINHQSMLDIIILEAISNIDFAWIAKEELGRGFFVGELLKRPNMILVDREDKKGLLKLLKDVKDRLEKNRVIAIFPEGTRSKNGDMLEFKQGAKVIAEKFALKVQPIVLTNTKDALDSQNILAKKTNIKMVYLPTIDSFEDGWYEKLREEMKKTYDTYNFTCNR